MGCGGSKAGNGVSTTNVDPGSAAGGAGGGEAKKNNKKSSPAPISPALAERLEELARAAFCGRVVAGTAGVGGEAGPATDKVVADATVELQEAEQAKVVQMLVELQRKEGLAKVLAADGKSAAAGAVELFLAGQAGKGKKRKNAGKAAVGWLVAAIELATHNDSAYDLSKALLGCSGFTVNLGGMQQWDTLRVGVQAIVEKVGRLMLAPLFEQYKLGDTLSDAVLLKYATFHSNAPLHPEAGQGPPRLSQRLAMPELFDLFESRCDFKDYAAMPERASLVAMLMLAALVQPHFEDVIKTIRTKLGGWCKYSVKKTKGYARVLIKLYSDYYQLASPRSQWIKDPLRCLLAGPNPVAMHAILAAVCAEFDGVVQLKNPYSLHEDGRAQRNHLLMLSATVLVDVGKTIGELAVGQEAEEILAAFVASSDHGEPTVRWESLCKQGMALLRDPAVANVPARMLAEVQFTLNAMKDGKKYMQLPYDVLRSASDVELYTFFAGNNREWDEEDAATVCLAAYRGQLDVVERLIAGGADANEVDATRNGSSAIYVAASNNHPDIVGYLLSAGADSNKATTDNGRTPLYQAAKFGHVEIAKQLVAGGAFVDQPKRSDGVTPLIMAAQNGHVDIVRELIASGASVDVGKATDDATALFMASMRGHVNVVKVLLAAGASATKKRTGMKLQRGSHEIVGTTPLMIATEHGHDDVVQLLQAHGDAISI